MFQDRRSFHIGMNAYVPGMQYASGLIHGQPTEFNLGSPAVGSATAVVTATPANSVANVIAALSYTSDARYGRSLILTVSGNPGNSCVHDVFGYDYLGQPMTERFTGASGVTAVLYGKKCFSRVSQIKTITPASNAVTYNIGTGTRLGLPFKGDVAWAKEGGVQVNVFKRDTLITVDRAAAQAIAGGSKWIRPPFPGFVKSLLVTPDGGGSTNDPVITVRLGGVAIVGLTATVDTSDTAGLTVSDDPTTPGYNANNRFVANGLIELLGAAAASATGDRLGLILTPTQFLLPDLTDPATAITGEPRGSYEAIATLDSLTEIRVGLVGDNQVNAAGNGGLEGLKHFA